MLTVVSLNIEFDRHMDTVLPFLQSEQADVVLINELLEIDIPVFEKVLGGKIFFSPSMRFKVSRGVQVFGSGVYSRLPARHEVMQYAGYDGEGLVTVERTSDHVPKLKYLLFTSQIEKDGETFQIGFTHFAWTKDGEANDYQRDALKKLFALTDQKGEMALFGDFNIPRGKELYFELTKKFTDTIPPSYQTSLDENLHRVGRERFKAEGMDNYVVDYCFTTAAYQAHNVSLRFGVSDHAAVLATIEKV